MTREVRLLLVLLSTIFIFRVLTLLNEVSRNLLRRNDAAAAVAEVLVDSVPSITSWKVAVMKRAVPLLLFDNNNIGIAEEASIVRLIMESFLFLSIHEAICQLYLLCCAWRLRSLIALSPLIF